MSFRLNMIVVLWNKVGVLWKEKRYQQNIKIFKVLKLLIDWFAVWFFTCVQIFAALYEFECNPFYKVVNKKGA